MTIGACTRVKANNSVVLGAYSTAETTDDKDESNVLSIGSSGFDGENGFTRRIINVTDPINDQDAATKKYVDDSVKNNTGTKVNAIAPTFIYNTGDQYGSYSPASVVNDRALAFGHAEASGYNSIAQGFGAKATAEDSIAIGRYVKANGKQSIALGSESETAASDSKVLSIGSDTIKRRIIHVSDPVNDTDAATKKYVDEAIAAAVAAALSVNSEEDAS